MRRLTALGPALVLALLAGTGAKTPSPAAAPAPSQTPAKAGRAAAGQAGLPDYRNARLPLEDRVADLMRRMTLQEKIAQLLPQRPQGLIDPTGTFTTRDLNRLQARQYDYRHPLSPRKSAILRNAIERYQMERTRLGIPVIFYGEALHGSMQYGATMFPMPIALASTWDPALLVKAYTIAGQEAAATGIKQVFAPDLDLARDPRWGRTEESFGEDPYLVTRMGLAEIRGLQGRHYLIGREHVLATAKHFTGHGDPEGGTNTAPVNVSERVVREDFLPAFRAAVEQGHVGSIMASYNEINGIPDHINHWLLARVLRQEWGFDGYVTSDGNGLQMLVERHHVAANYADAARLALEAGVEFDLSNGDVFRTLYQQVPEGRISVAQINRAVHDVLWAKFRLGLFDHPYVNVNAAAHALNTPAHRQVALQAALESMVLLKNQGALLPLSPRRYRTVAVIGPDAQYAHLGGYSRQPFHEVSILDGIRRQLAGKAKVLFSEGCQITTDINAQTPSWLAWYNNGYHVPSEAAQQREIAAAVGTARQADVVILVIGENESIDREAWSLQHLGDRDSLRLFGDQGKLASAILATGKPVVVVLVNGRPITINYLARHAPAILEAWFPGQEGGTAVADVLFGKYNPGGKLSISFPHTVGDLPDFYNHKPSAVIPWIGTNRKPLYPFGYGLSYTTFRFSHLRVVNPYETSAQRAAAAEKVRRDLQRVSGHYAGRLRMRNMSLPFSLDLVNTQGALSGQINSAMGSLAIQEGTYRDGRFAFKLNGPGGAPMSLTGTVGNGMLQGTLTMPSPNPRRPAPPARFSARKSSAPAVTIGTAGPLRIQFDVTNTGARPGDEVAEVYLHNLVSVVTQPVEELRRFERVNLQPGETRRLTFTLQPQDLAQWNLHMRFKVEPGPYQILVGGSSDRTIAARFQVTRR